MINRSVLQKTMLAFAMLATVACAKSNKDQGSSDNAAQPAPNMVEAPAYAAGEALHTSDIVSFTAFSTEGGAASNQDLAAIYTVYPTLGNSVTELSSIDRSIVTTESRIELYHAADLVMVLAVTDNVASVVWSRSGFTAESISFSSAVGEQKEMTSLLTFNLKDCTVVELQEQDQEQDQGQEQGKGKEPVKEQVKESVCQTISAVIDMKEQEQKQEQKQDLPDDSDQDQGKK